MLIVGFSDKTSKKFVRLVCGHFKHCVVIVPHANKIVLHQFVKKDKVVHIPITNRSITQLKQNGWIFIYMDIKPFQFNTSAWTCVSYVKHAIGLKKFWIQTPNALYKYLKKSDNFCQIFILLVRHFLH